MESKGNSIKFAVFLGRKTTRKIVVVVKRKKYKNENKKMFSIKFKKKVIPIQARGPSPNGRNAAGLYMGRSSEYRSGQNLSGSGKLLASRIIPNNDIAIGVPSVIIKSEFGIG